MVYDARARESLRRTKECPTHSCLKKLTPPSLRKASEASVLPGLAGGKLSRESLQLYAAQYYRHVEAFPQHLRVLATRAG